MPRAGRCPQCGEPVSPFAAGCAICGADLERHRREQAERAARRPALPTRSIRLPALDDDHVMLALTALLVALAPLAEWEAEHHDVLAHARERFDRMRDWRAHGDELQAWQQARSPRIS